MHLVGVGYHAGIGLGISFDDINIPHCVDVVSHAADRFETLFDEPEHGFLVARRGGNAI